MLIRLLMILGILVVLFWVALWFLRRSLVRFLKNVTTQANPQSTQTLNQGETLVKCAYCNTFIPKNRALIAKDEYYCCEEHTSLSQ